MVMCQACEGEMDAATAVTAVRTCELSWRSGVVLFGDEPGLEEADLPTRCHDCGVIVGGVHHPGCCVAQCERCAGQRLFCGCDDAV